MKYIDEYRDSSLVKPLVRELKKSLTRPVRLMEVCGTHTMAIFRTGIRTILPEGMEIVSGPGCPVCVTSASHMDAFIAMAEIPGVRVAIFGDLFRVPGSTGSLANAAARGALVEVVYSAMDSLELARSNSAMLSVPISIRLAPFGAPESSAVNASSSASAPIPIRAASSTRIKTRLSCSAC